ncbi:hypothetical protein [Streptomyces sp. NPDC001502]|uniref:hypothetical protein n=1 Tax=Streptomyces sp. NPDC001502 TaxID=3364578 RepID=UPI003689D529
MSHDLHIQPAVRSKRRISRFVMAATSAAFLSGAIVLPASAATMPSVRPATGSILAGAATVTYGDDSSGDATGPPVGDETVTYGGDSSTYYGPGTFAHFGDESVTPVGLVGASGGKGPTNYDPSNPHRTGSGGAYGSETCEHGYVWRGSYDGDSLCVTPTERDMAQNQ